jgi:hypothetical protein
VFCLQSLEHTSLTDEADRLWPPIATGSYAFSAAAARNGELARLSGRDLRKFFAEAVSPDATARRAIFIEVCGRSAADGSAAAVPTVGGAHCHSTHHRQHGARRGAALVPPAARPPPATARTAAGAEHAEPAFVAASGARHRAAAHGACAAKHSVPDEATNHTGNESATGAADGDIVVVGDVGQWQATLEDAPRWPSVAQLPRAALAPLLRTNGRKRR